MVTSTSGGVRANWRRSSAGVSPVRIPTVMSGTGSPRPLRRLPDAGERRAQVALHVDGERLERRDVEDAAAVPRLRRRLARRPAGRAPTGRPRASCRSRWARRRARACPPARPPTPPPARPWARRRPRRTSRGWRGRSRRVRSRHPWCVGPRQCGRPGPRRARPAQIAERAAASPATTRSVPLPGFQVQAGPMAATSQAARTRRTAAATAGRAVRPARGTAGPQGPADRSRPRRGATAMRSRAGRQGRRDTEPRRAAAPGRAGARRGGTAPRSRSSPDAAGLRQMAETAFLISS